MMVCRNGMHPDIGLIVYDVNVLGFKCSQQTAQLIDKAIRSIVDDCYKRVCKLIEKNKNKLQKLADELLIRETMDAQQVRQVVGI